MFDPEAAEELSRVRDRGASRPDKPDGDHNWRWNGKGWYTRPGWNNGRCPPGTSPTNHNTCLPDKAHPDDAAQYRTSAQVHPIDGSDGRYRHVPEDPDEHQFVSYSDHKHRARSAHYGHVDTSGPEGPVFKRRLGDNAARRVRGDAAREALWGAARKAVAGSPAPITGPSEPLTLPPNMKEVPARFGQWGTEIEVTQRFPDNPEHIPPIEVPAARFNKMKAHREKIKQHYVGQGYHPDYMDDLLQDRSRTGIYRQGERQRHYRLTNPPPEGSVGYPDPERQPVARRTRRRRPT